MTPTGADSDAGEPRMDAYRMTVRFERSTDDRCCLVTAWAHDRRPFRVSGMAGTAGLPHDLSTFAVEQALGLAGGFFNLTAHRATFRSSGLRPTRPGRAVIAAHRLELDAAERAVHGAEGAWRRGEAPAGATALDRVDQLWHDLAPGEHAELIWRRLALPVRISPGDRARPTRRPAGSRRIHRA